jgi:hypothetical protein
MTLLSEPTPAPKDSCQATGKETFLLTLTASRGNEEDEKEVEVVQLRSSGAEPIVFSTNRLEGDEVVASGAKNPELWAEHVQVVSVTSCDHRSIQVRHAGRSAMLPAGGTLSEAFAGTPLTGGWELRSRLTSDELRNPAGRPKQLEILTNFACVR